MGDYSLLFRVSNDKHLSKTRGLESRFKAFLVRGDSGISNFYPREELRTSGLCSSILQIKLQPSRNSVTPGLMADVTVLTSDRFFDDRDGVNRSNHAACAIS